MPLHPHVQRSCVIQPIKKNKIRNSFFFSFLLRLKKKRESDHLFPPLPPMSLINIFCDPLLSNLSPPALVFCLHHSCCVSSMCVGVCEWVCKCVSFGGWAEEKKFIFN